MLQASPDTDIIVTSLPNHRLDKTTRIINETGIVIMNVSQTLVRSVTSCNTKNTIVAMNQASPIDSPVMFK